jgi:hypothetical protein
LLRSGGQQLGWTYSTLFGCMRERPAMLREFPHGLETSTGLATDHGVEKRRESSGRGTVIHLYRTDPLAPAYPVTLYERRMLQRVERTLGEDHRVCAVCGHLGVPIVWGERIAPDPRTERGEAVLGGCCVEPFDTECVGCGRKWDSIAVDQFLAPMGPLVGQIGL